jgi:hypothetical protein
VERRTQDRSATIISEFENPLGRGLGQQVLQVPRTQQLTARHRMFRKCAGMLHFSDTLTRLANSAYPFSVNLRNTKKSPYPPLPKRTREPVAPSLPGQHTSIAMLPET